ncbi:putative GTP-binding protein EngB [bioreactor metagenome]|uniref:Putative GTP-binding protein EngB n=1 Tax=bioreactor metagenome TaxID=1076179 RepID=A0A645GXW7_9ZZZZ
MGKSNVGKSSLINCVCNNYKLAKTSQTPGKTRLINFFHINKRFSIVDLPGYGFARASKQEQGKWGELIETYLKSGRVNHIILLLDIRHLPTAEDKQMFQWIIYYGVPFTIVMTKADKLPRSKRTASAAAAVKALGAPKSPLIFSSQDKQGLDTLIKRIGGIAQDCENLLNNTIDT